MKRVLVVTETNEYRVPMLPDESKQAALARYLDTGPDTFYSATRERSARVETIDDWELDPEKVRAQYGGHE